MVNRFALCCGFVAVLISTAWGAPEAGVLELLDRGHEQLRRQVREGASGAVQEWYWNSPFPLEGRDARFAAATAGLGDYVGHEIIGFRRLSRFICLAFDAVHFRRGTLFVRFVIHHDRSQTTYSPDTLVQEFDFSSDPMRILPDWVLEPSPGYPREAAVVPVVKDR